MKLKKKTPTFQIFHEFVTLIVCRKDSEIRELLRKNQYLSDEMNLLISEKKQKEEVVNKELDIKKEEIDRLQMRIRQLENRNIQLQKDIDPVSKDLYARYGKQIYICVFRALNKI